MSNQSGNIHSTVGWTSDLTAMKAVKISSKKAPAFSCSPKGSRNAGASIFLRVKKLPSRDADPQKGGIEHVHRFTVIKQGERLSVDIPAVAEGVSSLTGLAVQDVQIGALSAVDVGGDVVDDPFFVGDPVEYRQAFSVLTVKVQTFAFLHELAASRDDGVVEHQTQGRFALVKAHRDLRVDRPEEAAVILSVVVFDGVDQTLHAVFDALVDCLLYSGTLGHHHRRQVIFQRAGVAKLLFYRFTSVFLLTDSLQIGFGEGLGLP